MAIIFSTYWPSRDIDYELFPSVHSKHFYDIQSFGVVWFMMVWHHHPFKILLDRQHRFLRQVNGWFSVTLPMWTCWTQRSPRNSASAAFFAAILAFSSSICCLQGPWLNRMTGSSKRSCNLGCNQSPKLAVDRPRQHKNYTFEIEPSYIQWEVSCKADNMWEQPLQQV